MASSAPAPFQTVKRSRVWEDIVTQILQLMGDGNLTAGSRLPAERELAASLGVSRPSVREAMRQLELMGVIESRQGAGAFVKEVSDDDLVQPLGLLLRGRKHLLRDILETRKVIEPHIARLAATKASPQAIAGLQQLVDRQQRKVDAGQLAIDEDSQFHHGLARASGNRVLLLLVESCMDLLIESRKLNLQSPERARRSVEGHAELLRALKVRDADAAFAAMARHLDGIEAAIRSRGDLL
ncbi:MAG TPA: FadR/GntR family transcriptional regulator [Chloroflexota bacterium]|nr:FadR/GntR family transcriptional regulator [Chloroflexota bacterium]